MPQQNRLVGITPEERRLRGAIGQAKRWGRPASEVAAAEVRYYLAVARRKAAEYAAQVEQLEAELERLS